MLREARKMMPAIRQQTIWDGLERETPPGLKEVESFLMVLREFDRELVSALERFRGHGNDGLPLRAMWNLFAVKQYLRHRQFSELLGELERNSDLARVLEFEEIGPNVFHLPSGSALSRLHVKLQDEPFLSQVQEIFVRTVEALKVEYPAFGRDVALDASDVRTHARPPRAKRDEQGAVQEGEQIPSADKEASWSVKTKYVKDKDGKVHKEKKTTFGYKFYAVVDSALPAVLAVDVETGSTSDFHMAMPMLDQAIENLGAGHIQTLAMDKGFDSEENVIGAHERDCAAIVPVREVAEELKKLSVEDREKAIVEGGNVVYDPYTGEVACYSPSEAGGEEMQRRSMIYAGFEKDRQSHKFRCPLGALACSTCKGFASCAAGSSGRQGRQIRVPMETDARRFAPVYPGGKRWKRLYKGRTAVERVNSYVKEVLQLDKHCLRGKSAIKLRSVMACLTLNLRTLMSVRQQNARGQAAADAA